MTVKPADEAPMNEQHIRTVADSIPGVIYQFYIWRTGESGLPKALAGPTGTGDIFIDADGRVPDARPEYRCLAGHRTREEILGECVAERTTGDGDETNAGAIFPHAGIIISTPEGT